MTSTRSITHPINVKDPSPSFGQSGFFQHESLTGLLRTNLNGPIHTLFAQSMFAEGFDYTMMSPALRLATRFVIICLPFFHALLQDKIWEAGEIDSRGKPIFQLADPVEGLTTEQVEFTLQRLSELARHLTYCIDNVNNSVNGWCRHTSERVGLGMKGTGSRIGITHRVYKMLLNAHDDPSDVVQQQLATFYFANILLHELAHAAFFAAVPDNYHGHQFYVGTVGQSTEHGFEIIAWLFGGVIPEASIRIRPAFYLDEDRQKYSNVGRMLTGCNWPCPTRSTTYDSCGEAFAVRGTDSNVELLWNAPFVHVHQMFQDKFWQEVVPRKGRKALFFEKTTGYRFAPGAGHGRSRQPLIPHANETSGIPRGYLADKYGLIRRKPDKFAEMQAIQSLEARFPQATPRITSTNDKRPSTIKDKASALYRQANLVSTAQISGKRK